MTKDELTALRQLCAQAQEARADLDNDFPVGAVARGKWQDARRAMADACPRLLAHIEDCHEAVDDFCEIRVHVVLLLAIIRDANISLPPHDAAHVERISKIAHQSMPSIQKALGNLPKGEKANANC